ncbi:ParB/RepB/Spo0J family partition protein [Vibrio parahaemolyticus]|uniref:ParB/RepB/Spo0J family partition protein n=2 Tax=Vibrio parahaemolyticus TaxID=670 RepID=UPI000945D54A|nr:ParB/RepB/Spo0J family partition protein [Vibrio parahaemolyticus]MBE3687212.1 ParB N-terminal domain-containing protein [Vibrio parahaemolyticus]MBE3803983.1 ParB N-terminal domain-containing protein [Vibrio parahaemolyticus]MBE3808186.1 ParB N-terminal domain-containing protein [Vibrio parahaemolyticus]MBE4231527.1 ParB N-terminal domain-containing protein [Vibrio parahaemolyticus]MBE4435448.1 ParB N-terminal domain-containing protein [Vibrio parahaemolyticus]
MNALTQNQTHSMQQSTTNVSTLDSQATAQNDNSIQMLPISSLVVSELNVRKSKASKEDDLSLQASILAHGLIQNLVALPIDEAGLYPIVSGGRRLTALNALIESGQLASDSTVAVKVLSEEEAKTYASEISLTENFTRAAMHPVDEFEAFSKMVEEGATVEAVAQRFGKTKLYIHQRMKLAAVLPCILDAYRQGNVNLERVMLFTIASPERQGEVWEQVKDSKWYNDNQVRNMLKEKAIEEDHYLVKFVGREEYEKAGGLVTSDLFSEKVYIEDKALIESLATQKIQLEADKLTAQGWKWTEIVLQRTFDETKGYLELQGNKGQYKKAEKALAGCVLVLDYKGEINVIKGLVAKSERKALKALQAEQAKKNTKGEPDTQNASGDKAADTSMSASVVEYSNALSEDLKAHRLVIAKHALMLNSNLAIDALHFSLCNRAFVPFGSTPLDVSINRTDLEPKQGDFAENQALARIEAHKETFDLSWLEVNASKERFEAFVKLDADEKQKQVAYATALMLRASMAQDDGRFDFEFLYQELSFDAADYWRPSTDSFLKRIDKDSLIDIARPVMSDEWIKRSDSLKKGDLVKQMDVWLDGADKSLTESQKAHFAKWMPQGF